MTISRHDFLRLAALFAAAPAGTLLSACGGSGDEAASGPSPSPSPSPSPAPAPAPAPAKSAKRGIAYDLATEADIAALSPSVSWWYNWSPVPRAGLPANVAGTHGMGFVPMVWNGNFDDAAILAWLRAHPEVRHLLAINEPNLVEQANMTPQQAAAIWPRLETLVRQAGVQLVGPAITWGTMAGYEDPVVWMDAFLVAYRAANNGRDPSMDAIAFHWYDYGLEAQLDRLAKYGKPFWVTEMANWHQGDGSAQIDSLAKQQAQMADMVAACERRADVQRYAWFTGRMSPDPHFSILLAGDGQLSGLGATYVGLRGA